MKKKGKDVQRACTNKKAFFTTQAASKASTKIRDCGGPQMRWYQCSYCNKWHLSSKPREGMD